MLVLGYSSSNKGDSSCSHGAEMPYCPLPAGAYARALGPTGVGKNVSRLLLDSRGRG